MAEQRPVADRRHFLTAAASGAALATSSSIAAGENTTGGSPRIAGRSELPGRLPREVRIATVTQDRLQAQSPEQMVDKMLQRMRQAASSHPDLVCLPEVFPVANVRGGRPPLQSVATDPLKSLCRPIAEFAKEHRCYVVCPTYTTEGGKFYNAAILIDRDGKEVGQYRKIRLTTGELERGLTPGPEDPPVFEADFGKLGFQICFDIEWPEGWRKLRDAGAEIVVWPSAFAGGRMINMAACANRYVVVSSTRKDTSKVCDIAGEELATTSRWNDWAVATVNLEKLFLHTWPVVNRFEEMLAKYGEKISIRTYAEEEWSIVESRSPDVRIADLIGEFDLVQIDQMLLDAQRKQNEMR